MPHLHPLKKKKKEQTKEKEKEKEVKKLKKEKKEKNSDWNGVAEGRGMSPDAGGNPCKRETNTG